MPEFGGGWFDPWGGAWFDGKGYAESRRTRDAAYERRFYLTNLANGLTLHNVYMTFGGTSWGWLPAPVVYTSYDYGAAIDEARNVTDKIAPMHQLGHLFQRVPDFAKLDRAADVTAEGLKVYHLTNPDTGSHVYIARNDGTDPVTTDLPTDAGTLPLTVPGKDAKLLTTGLPLGKRTLKYCTAAPMACVTAGRQDIAVFAGRRGEMAELVLKCPAEPYVQRLDPEAGWVYDRGELHVNAPLGEGGLTRVLVQKGETDTPLLLLFADDATAVRIFPYDTPSGTLLVYGPALLRHVELRGSEVRLTGDITERTSVEVWGPRGIDTLVWNGRRLPTRVTLSGSPDDHRDAAGHAGGAAARAGRLADADGEPGGGPELRRLLLAARRPDHVAQHHGRPGGAAGPLRRRLRLPLRGRLVPGRPHRHDRRRGGLPRLQHRHAGPADGLAGRRTAGHPPDAGAGQERDDPQGHMGTDGGLPGARAAALPGRHVLSVLVRRMPHDQDGRRSIAQRRPGG